MTITTGFTIPGGRRIDLGDSERITDADVRETYETLAERARQIGPAMARRDRLIDERTALLNESDTDLAADVWRGAEISEKVHAKATRINELAVEIQAAQEEINALTGATRIGTIELDAHLEYAADDLAKAALAKAKRLGSKLVMAQRVVDDFLAEHDATLGLIHLLETRAAGDPQLVVSHIVQTPRVPASLASEHLQTAMEQLAHEVGVAERLLKPSKKAKAPKPEVAPAEPPTPAQAAPAAPSAPEAMAFEIGEDTDDDDA